MPLDADRGQVDPVLQIAPPPLQPFDLLAHPRQFALHVQDLLDRLGHPEDLLKPLLRALLVPQPGLQVEKLLTHILAPDPLPFHLHRGSLQLLQQRLESSLGHADGQLAPPDILVHLTGRRIDDVPVELFHQTLNPLHPRLVLLDLQVQIRRFDDHPLPSGRRHLHRFGRRLIGHQTHLTGLHIARRHSHPGFPIPLLTPTCRLALPIHTTSGQHPDEQHSPNHRI